MWWCFLLGSIYRPIGGLKGKFYGISLAELSPNIFSRSIFLYWLVKSLLWHAFNHPSILEPAWPSQGYEMELPVCRRLLSEVSWNYAAPELLHIAESSRKLLNSQNIRPQKCLCLPQKNFLKMSFHWGVEVNPLYIQYSLLSFPFSPPDWLYFCSKFTFSLAGEKI